MPDPRTGHPQPASATVLRVTKPAKALIVALGVLLVGSLGVAAYVMKPSLLSRHSAPAAPTAEFFAATSIWNRPLADDQPVSPYSTRVVAELRRQMDAAGGPWMNIEEYSVPVYRVGPDQPRIRVRDRDGNGPTGASPYRWSTVPLPTDARPAAGDDAHLVVWQPSSDTMWEFWGFAWQGDEATALHGARIPRVSRSAGILASPYGATASGLPAVAGLITDRDIAAGRIDHALAIAIPEPRREVLTLPATRTDGWSRSVDAPMEGTRFRLDPTLDLDALDLHPLVRMMAEAAQRYGIVVRDKAGAVVFFGEDPKGSGSDPFTPLLGGASRGSLLSTFPWERLQMLPAEPVCCWANQDYTDPAVSGS